MLIHDQRGGGHEDQDPMLGLGPYVDLQDEGQPRGPVDPIYGDTGFSPLEEEEEDLFLKEVRETYPGMFMTEEEAEAVPDALGPPMCCEGFLGHSPNSPDNARKIFEVGVFKNRYRKVQAHMIDLILGAVDDEHEPDKMGLETSLIFFCVMAGLFWLARSLPWFMDCWEERGFWECWAIALEELFDLSPPPPDYGPTRT